MSNKKTSLFKEQYLNSQHPPWCSFYVDYLHLIEIIHSPGDQKINNNKNQSFIKRASSITVRPRIIDSLPKDSPTRIFIDKLDDEIDKVCLFVIRKQGDIANKFLQVKNELVSNRKSVNTQDIFTASEELLCLIHFIQANIIAIDKLLAVHDRIMAPAGIIKIEYLFLSGNIGREWSLRSIIPRDRGRFRVIYQHDVLDALVGLAEIVYYQWVIKHNLVHSKNHRGVVDRTLSKIQYQSGQDIARMMREEDYNDPMPLTIKSFHDSEISRDESFAYLLPMAGERFYTNNQKLNEKLSLISSDILLDRTQETFLQIYTAHSRLSKSGQFVRNWAIASGIERLSGPEIDFVDENTCSDRKRERDISSALNLANSFLYMVSYYMVAPTSGQYAKMLGLEPSMSGAIIGFTAVAALIATVLYSWWTSYSYKDAFIFSSVCCIIGNIAYALGLPFHSLSLVLVGRFLNGFGSARAINRRFIADAYSTSGRTAASAAFVASGAAGMAFGPALSATLPLLIANDRSNLWWQEENAPAWIVTGLWIIFLFLLVRYFQNPDIVNSKLPQEKNINSKEACPLISNDIENCQKNKEIASSYHGEQPMWKRPVCIITIFLVFLLKSVLELVLSSTAPITYYYFNWSASRAGLYLAIGNGLVLPAVYLVTYLSRYYQDRQLIIFSQIAMTIGSVSLIQFVPKNHPYSIVQFIFGTCLLFISPNTMEGPAMSLLSKNIPKSLSKGIFNLGFFTTEAGFGGRVMADFYLTVCGTVGMENLVNCLYGYLSILNTLVIILLCFSFDALVDSSCND